MREALARQIERAWERLAAPGTWWSGAQRLAIAAEARAARACALCARRKQALSPYTEAGEHDCASELPAPLVDAVHRLATDAARLKESWLSELLAQGVSEEQYVEAVGVVACLTALDTFDRALGRTPRRLPSAAKGEPTKARPRGARAGLAWVSTVPPEAVAAGEVNPYPVHGTKNIHRALSLVPQEVFNFFDLDVELYLRDHEIRDFDREYRALAHPQIELLAARVSALNGCYY